MGIGNAREADVDHPDQAMGGGERPQHLGSVLEVRDIEVLLGAHPHEGERGQRPAPSELSTDMGVVEAGVLVQDIDIGSLAETAHDAEAAVAADDVDGHVPRVQRRKCGEDTELAHLLHADSPEKETRHVKGETNVMVGCLDRRPECVHGRPVCRDLVHGNPPVL
jgi:hypothetical protein